jgi:hypothetical protein
MKMNQAYIKKIQVQLHDSMQWARDNYPTYAERLVALTVAKVINSDKDANYPPETRVIDIEGCQLIGQALHQLCQKLAKNGPVFFGTTNCPRGNGEFQINTRSVLR